MTVFVRNIVQIAHEEGCFELNLIASAKLDIRLQGEGETVFFDF